MSNTISKEELSKVSYGPALRKKLEELGIPEVWEQGKKKAEIIKEAVAKLEKLKEKKDQGLSTEDAKEKIAKEKAIEKEGIEKFNKKVEKQKEKENNSEVEKLKVLTKEVLEKGLVNANQNLKHANEVHRKILLKKIANIQEALKSK